MSALEAALAGARSAGKFGAKKKKKKVDLGEKGSFTIKHPGWTKDQAAKSGMSTKEWAQEHSGDSGVAGRRARSALGLMGMKKG
jgi:hypothetical protein